jgi:hypothetical protein
MANQIAASHNIRIEICTFVIHPPNRMNGATANDEINADEVNDSPNNLRNRSLFKLAIIASNVVTLAKTCNDSLTG